MKLTADLFELSADLFELNADLFRQLPISFLTRRIKRFEIANSFLKTPQLSGRHAV